MLFCAIKPLPLALALSLISLEGMTDPRWNCLSYRRRRTSGHRRTCADSRISTA
jgi:hypothetical protein